MIEACGVAPAARMSCQPRTPTCRGRAAGKGLSRRGRESAPRLILPQLFRGYADDIAFRLRGYCRGRAAFRCVQFCHEGRRDRQAAHDLLPHLERGQRIDAPVLRMAMENAFGASDADGGWDWKAAYDACEAVTVLFLRKFGPAMRSRADSSAAMLRCWQRSRACFPPTPAARRERSASAVQYPILLGLAASAAAAITPMISCWSRRPHRLLAILAELSAGPSFSTNSPKPCGASLASLSRIAVTRFDGAHINDHLDAGITPSVVLMNPPFSAIANVDRRLADAALRHIASPWRGSPRAVDWSRSLGRVVPPIIRSGPTRSSACKNTGASSSAPPWLARCSPSTHHHRDTPDRHRSVARGRSDGTSVISWHRAVTLSSAESGSMSVAIADLDGCYRFATTRPARCQEMTEVPSDRRGQRSMTVRRVSMVVPCLANNAPAMAALKTTRPCSCMRMNASVQTGLSGNNSPSDRDQSTASGAAPGPTLYAASSVGQAAIDIGDGREWRVHQTTLGVMPASR